MKVITCAARKGGVGKTMLTASFAVLAHQDCEREGVAEPGQGPLVAVIDHDPQGCLTSWHNSRTVAGPAIVEVAPRALQVRLEHLEASGTRYVFIDTPPGQSEIRMVAMMAADLVVIPTRPGELDLAATIKAVALAERCEARYVVLPNGANFRSRAMGEAIRMLRDAGLDTLQPVHNRVALALTGGRTLSETDPQSRGAAELAAAWRAINHILMGACGGQR